MAYRGTVHRGTPYHHVKSGAEGRAAGKPGGMDGTSPSQYGSEKGGYRDAHVTGHGTPYHSEEGNPPGARREVGDHPTHGIVKSEGGLDMNHPDSSGVGVVLDGANKYARGYDPKDEPTLDSPVPRHAAVFETSFIKREDEAHAGRGNEGTARDNILEIGGVLSRGMVGTSNRHGPETELMEDDEFGMEGHATQSQPKGGVKHEKE